MNLVAKHLNGAFLFYIKEKKSLPFDEDRFSDIRFRVAKVNKSVVYNYCCYQGSFKYYSTILALSKLKIFEIDINFW